MLKSLKKLTKILMGCFIASPAIILIACLLGSDIGVTIGVYVLLVTLLSVMGIDILIQVKEGRE